MKEIYWSINIPTKKYEELAGLFETTEGRDDIPRYATVHSFTKVVSPTLELDAKICSSDVGDPLWTEIVLFKNGSELCHSEVGGELDEPLELEQNGVRYVVQFVKPEDTTAYVHQKPVDVSIDCPACEENITIDYDDFCAEHGDPPDWQFDTVVCPRCGQKMIIDYQDWT